MHLTEQMIFTRSRERDFNSIQKLNLWGCDLTDVSILEDLPNLEVVVLSENHINSLKHFRHCFSLQELYLHSNDIEDIDELIYLKNLPLKRLVLAGNPCCGKCEEEYRMNVLKMLPFLEWLDNRSVTTFELNMAMNLRVMERENEMEDANQQETVEPSSPTNSSQQAGEACPAYVENVPLFVQQPSTQFGSPAAMPQAKLKQIYTQPGLQNQMSPNRQCAGACQEPNLYRSKSNNCAVYHNSQVDLTEWQKQNQTRETQFKLPSISNNSRPGYLTERTSYRVRDELSSDYGYASPSSNIPRLVTTIPPDSVSLESSRNSSIVSSNQSRLSYPRSRRVNLLCASLRFILELDALSLVDVLSAIRERIDELKSIGQQ